MERRNVLVIVVVALVLGSLLFGGLGGGRSEQAQQQAWLDGFALGTYTAAQGGSGQAVQAPPVGAAAGVAAAPIAPVMTQTWHGGWAVQRGPGFFGIFFRILFFIFLFGLVKKMIFHHVARRHGFWGGPALAHAGCGPMPGAWHGHRHGHWHGDWHGRPQEQAPAGEAGQVPPWAQGEQRFGPPWAAGRGGWGSPWGAPSAPQPGSAPDTGNASSAESSDAPRTTGPVANL